MTGVVNELPPDGDGSDALGWSECLPCDSHRDEQGERDDQPGQSRDVRLRQIRYERAIFRALSRCSTALSIAFSSEPSFGGASTATTIARSTAAPSSFSTSAATLRAARTTSYR